MTTATRTTLLGAALLALAAAPARAQDGTDPRWTAWLGCWDPVVEQGPAWVRDAAPRVCILPVAGTAAVELVTLERDSIVSRQRVDASGERHDAPRDGCTGFERGAFSAAGTRVYLRAEHVCPGAARPRVATALMSIAPGGEWLDVQGVGMGTRASVRVTRYQAVRPGAAVPDSIARLLSGRAFAVSTARAAAGERVRVPDVIEASREVGGDVVEAWLVEAGDDFRLDGRTLTALAATGVPGNVTDVMVALSYPRTFTIRENRGGPAPRDRADERVRAEPGTGDVAPYGWGYYGGYNDWYSPYDSYGYGRYGYGYPWRQGYGGYGPGGYGYGWNGPIIIVVGGGSSGGSQRPGRVVNGRGYQAGEGAPSSRASRPSGTTSSGGASASSGRDSGGNSGSSGSGTTSSGGYGSGGSGGETGRTAKPRP